MIIDDIMPDADEPCEVVTPLVPPPSRSYEQAQAEHLPTSTDDEDGNTDAPISVINISDDEEWAEDVDSEPTESNEAAEETEAEEEEAEAEPAPSREELYRIELERARLEHEMEIKENVELAKNASLYETYEAKEAHGLRIFAARRRGRSHIQTGAPCQDYCTSSTTKRGVILADADGVGSCERSDVGSRIACEITVAFIKETDDACPDEKTLVARLLSPRFKEILVKRWLRAVLDHLKENPTESDKTYELYASTLMFAVITESYYVVGNLGDGQILLFNEAEGLKLRRHPRKTSTKVRALVHPNCYREDFIVEKYSRSDYCAVLLSTDGMYDVLSNGTVLHEYALEIKERFLNAGEPLQPFCFKEEGEPFKDIFSHRTHDDCSIVLACDTAADCTDSMKIYREVRKRFVITLPEAVRGNIRVYISEGEDGRLFRTVVSPTVEIPDLRKLRDVRFEMPIASYFVDGLCYRTYLCDTRATLEELYHGGSLREQSEHEPLSSLSVIKIYDALCECERKLSLGGYCLSDFADCLALYDGEKERICLYPEAIRNKDEDARDLKARLFPSLYGRLTSAKLDIPIFHLGFLSKGQRTYMTPDVNGQKFCVCLEKNAGYSLENRGEDAWFTEIGRIEVGERLMLTDGLCFEAGCTDGKTFACRFKKIN